MPSLRPTTTLLCASGLENDEVFNAEGERLGHIEELMLDLPSGRIAYAVLSVGGFFGIGHEFFAIPPSAMQVDAAGRILLSDVDKDRLLGLKGFPKDDWPDAADERLLPPKRGGEV